MVFCINFCLVKHKLKFILIQFSILSHLPTQTVFQLVTGGIQKAQIIQTRPDLPSATRQRSEKPPLLCSYRRRDGTLWSLPYPQRRAQAVILVLETTRCAVFIFQRPPYCCTPALFSFYMFVSKSQDAPCRLSPLRMIVAGDKPELAKKDTQ